MDPVALARELGKAMAGSEEYKAYQKAKQQVEEHEAAKIMLEDFRKKQLALEKKALSGEEPSSAEVEQLKKLSEILGYNPYIREYLLAEMRFTHLVFAVQKAIADAAGLDLPGFGGEKFTETGEEEGRLRKNRRAGEKRLKERKQRKRKKTGENSVKIGLCQLRVEPRKKESGESRPDAEDRRRGRGGNGGPARMFNCPTSRSFFRFMPKKREGRPPASFPGSPRKRGFGWWAAPFRNGTGRRSITPASFMTPTGTGWPATGSSISSILTSRER